MTTDDLRARAREAAWEWCSGDTGDTWADVANRSAFVAGFLAAHEQLPGREDIAEALHRERCGCGDVGQDIDFEAADATLALIRGGQS